MPPVTRNHKQANMDEQEMSVDMEAQEQTPPTSPHPTTNDTLRELVEILRTSSTSREEVRWRPTPKVPIFAGRLHEDPNKFIRKLVDYFTKMSIDNEDYQEHINDSLTDAARRWYRPIANINMSFDSFKQKFLQYFDGPGTRAQMHISLLTEAQRSSETGRDYVARKMALAQREPPEIWPDRLTIIKALLLPDYRFALAHREFTNFEELLEAVTQLDAAKQGAPSAPTQKTDTANSRNQNRANIIPQSTGKQASAPPAPTARWQAASDTPSPEEPHSARHAHAQQRREPYQAFRPQPRFQPRPPPFPCIYCRGDHWNRDCPNKHIPKDNNASQSKNA